MQRILIMGLPGSGKTTLANQLKQYFESNGLVVLWLNADSIRSAYDDWDFTESGRIRQSVRMRELSTQTICDICIADFVAPLEQMRMNFDPDWLIWVDTITAGRFDDTNQVFVKPTRCDFHITTQDAMYNASNIGGYIMSLMK